MAASVEGKRWKKCRDDTQKPGQGTQKAMHKREANTTQSQVTMDLNMERHPWELKPIKQPVAP